MTSTIYKNDLASILNDSTLSIILTESVQLSPEMKKITIIEMLENVLNEIGLVGGIQASVLVSKEGLMMASDNTASGVDSDIIGAMLPC